MSRELKIGVIVGTVLILALIGFFLGRSGVETAPPIPQETVAPVAPQPLDSLHEGLTTNQLHPTPASAYRAQAKASVDNTRASEDTAGEGGELAEQDILATLELPDGDGGAESLDSAGVSSDDREGDPCEAAAGSGAGIVERAPSVGGEAVDVDRAAEGAEVVGQGNDAGLTDTREAAEADTDAADSADETAGGEQGDSTGGEQGDTNVAAESEGSQWYVVQEGDTLWGIARMVYGDGAMAEALYQANRDVLSGPDKLRVDMSLRIPSRESLADQQ